MTSPDDVQKDKMILLAQLKRYDEKIKQKIDSSSGGFITSVDDDPMSGIQLLVNNGFLSASLDTDILPGYVAQASQDNDINDLGVIQLKTQTELVNTGFGIDPKGGILANTKNSEVSGIAQLFFSINVGKGVKLDPTTGALEANVDGITIGINGNTGMMSVRPTEEIEVTNQPTSGSVTAQYNPGTVCIHFNDALVTGSSKTLVGKIPSVYAPSTAVTGVVLNSGSSWIMSAYAKVEQNGSIYINPLYPSAADLGWTGTLTYLI